MAEALIEELLGLAPMLCAKPKPSLRTIILVRTNFLFPADRPFLMMNVWDGANNWYVRSQDIACN
eukprot:7340826-Alexandrium_andersonii.AAC.1